MVTGGHRMSVKTTNPGNAGGQKPGSNAAKSEESNITLPPEPQLISAEKLQEIIAELVAIPNEIERAKRLERLAGIHKISKRAVQKEVKKALAAGKSDKPQEKLSAGFQNLVDVALDAEGDTVYLVDEGGALPSIRTEFEIDGIIHRPPDRRNMPYSLVRDVEAQSYMAVQDDGVLFDDLGEYLALFSALEAGQRLVLVCKILLTWIQDHPGIKYMPMILLFAVHERGKSRTCKAALTICFRGVHVIDLRESNLFRFSRNHQSTLFFDVSKLWEKCEKNQSEDIILGRFEKGAQVARVLNPDKGAFLDTEFFPIYGPTLIATNENVHKILGSRCISITMPNTPGVYQDPDPELGLPLKAQLTGWRFRTMRQPLPDVDKVTGIDGRLWDISKPLLQVCKMLKPARYQELVDFLLELASDKTESQRESIEGKIVQALDALVRRYNTTSIAHADVVDYLNSSRPDNDKFKSGYLGLKIKALGIHHSTSAGKSILQVKPEALEILKKQYGIQAELLNNI